MSKKIIKTYHCLVDYIEDGIVFGRTWFRGQEELYFEIKVKLFPRMPKIYDEFKLYVEKSPQGFTRNRVSMYNPPKWTKREIKEAAKRAKEYEFLNDQSSFYG